MSEEQWGQIRQAVEGAGGGGPVVIVIPGGTGGPARSTTLANDDIVLDLTIPDYIERYASDLSETRVADLCRDGVFPDTVAADGTIVKGAYKLGRWYITREGIRERQRLARTGVAREEEPGDEQRAPDRATDAATAEIPVPKPPRAGAQTGPTKARRRPAPKRARQNAWKEVIRGA